MAPVREFLDSLPFGKAPFLLFVLVLVSGGYLLLHPIKDTEADIRLWTFVNANEQNYTDSLPSFKKTHPGIEVDIQMIAYPALESRLRSAFWADLDVPEIVELEISHAGGFFRGPVEDVGFIDLTPYIERDNLRDRMVETRFAPYQSRGKQFGLPLDIHPVMLAYRRDLFEAHGINAGDLDTWDDFIEAGKMVREKTGQFMIRLPDSNAQFYEIFLFQNGGGYFDPQGDLIMDDAIALETLLFYVPLVAGENRIGSDLGSDDAFTQAFESGYFWCILAPDWLAHHIEQIVPGGEGKLALMPLPAFEPGGRRTSTWGGTMIGITKYCEDPELAWKLVKHLRLDPKDAEERFRQSGVVPPFKDAWDMEAFQEPSEYWSGQAVGALYASLADEVPPQYASPFVTVAKNKMSEVVASCSAYYRRAGEEGFEEFARERLDQAAADVRRAMTRNPFR